MRQWRTIDGFAIDAVLKSEITDPATPKILGGEPDVLFEKSTKELNELMPGKASYGLQMLFKSLLFLGVAVAVVSATPMLPASATSEALDWLGLPVVKKEDIDGEIIGEITGKVDGAPFTVYAMASEIPDYGLLTSASWRSVGSDEVKIDIIGYREHQEDRRGMVTLHLWFDNELNLIVDESYFYYYKSAFVPLMGPDGSIQVTSVERIDDEFMRVSGTFAGTAIEDWGDDEVDIVDGVFSIDMIPQDTFW